MTKGNPAVLEAFTKTPFTALGRTRDVYRLGSGPTVLILSEMPGITPSLVTFAKRVVAQGFSVAIPTSLVATATSPVMASSSRRSGKSASHANSPSLPPVSPVG